MNEFSVIILSAGSSQRMGSSKARLPFNKDLTFLDQLIAQYSKAGLANIHVVSQEERRAYIPKEKVSIHWIQNMETEKGRAWSIYRSLRQVNATIPVFIQNIDNPFTDKKLIKSMCLEYQSGQMLIPVIKDRKGHPIILPPQVIEYIQKKNFESFDFKDSIQKFPARYMPWEDERILANINTLQDYHHWFE